MKNSLHLPPEHDTIQTERMFKVVCLIALGMFFVWGAIGYWLWGK